MDHTNSKSEKIDESQDKELEEQKEGKYNITYDRASVFDLYKYVETKYIILLVVGTINSVVCGWIFPLKFLVIREIFGSINIENQN